MRGGTGRATREASARLDTAGEGIGSAPEEGRPAEAKRPGDGAGSPLERWLWFGALWLGGVAAVTLLAWGIRTMILP